MGYSQIISVCIEIPTYRSGFNRIVAHGFVRDVLRFSLYVYIQRHTYRSGFNQVGAHEFVLDVLRFSLYIYTETYI